MLKNQGPKSHTLNINLKEKKEFDVNSLFESLLKWNLRPMNFRRRIRRRRRKKSNCIDNNEDDDC